MTARLGTGLGNLGLPLPPLRLSRGERSKAQVLKMPEGCTWGGPRTPPSLFFGGGIVPNPTSPGGEGRRSSQPRFLMGGFSNPQIPKSPNPTRIVPLGCKWREAASVPPRVGIGCWGSPLQPSPSCCRMGRAGGEGGKRGSRGLGWGCSLPQCAPKRPQSHPWVLQDVGGRS